VKHQGRFAEVAAALAYEPGLARSEDRHKRFGHLLLKVDRKIFAMLSSAGHFVVKLPKARVAVLETGGAGKRFEASQGRPMKEWLQVDSQFQEWPQLAREALSFVRRLP